MKNIIVHLACFTLLIFPFISTAQVLNNAISLSGAGDMRINKTALDAQGNIYSTGYFVGTVDFDPSPTSTYTLMTNSSSGDVFITKFSSTGTFIWVKRVGSASTEVGQDIAIDGNGNIIVVGYFNGTADMNPGTGTNNLYSSLNNDDMFILKLDSAGVYVHAFKIGDADLQIPLALALDMNNNIIVTGYFHGSVNFNPAGSAFLSNISSGSNIFIAKYTNTGAYVWAKNIGPVSSYEKGQDITTDQNGDVYVTGYFQSVTDFDPSTAAFNLTPTNAPNAFLLKLAANGSFIYAKNMGGKQGYGVAVDQEKSVYVYGDMWNTSDMDPNATVYNLFTGTTTGYYGFLTKLDSTGTFVWSQVVTNEGITHITKPNYYAIAVDNQNYVYLTGAFTDSFDFDRGGDSLKLNAISRDGFVSRIDKNGNLIWAINLGSNDQGTDIAIQPNGQVVVSGHFAGTADFDPTATGVFNLVSAGSNDAFITIYNNGMFPLSINEKSLQAKIVDRGIEISWQNNYTLNDLYTTIQKSEDGVHFYNLEKITINANQKKYFYIDNKVKAGTNYYKLMEEALNGTIKYSKMVSCNIDNRNDEIIIFPNPIQANHTISLQLPSNAIGKAVSITIRNFNGQKIATHQLTSSQTKNGLHYLATDQITNEGNYLFEFVYGNKYQYKTIKVNK